MNDNNKVKILYIISTLRRCGPTNQLYGILKYLDKDKFIPTILTISPENKEISMINKFEKLDVEINSLDLNKIEYLIKSKKRLKKYLSTHDDYDIIHTTGVRPDKLVNSLKIKNHLTTIRNYAFDDYPVKFGKILGYILAYRHINIIKKINYKISCSKTIKNILKNNHAIQSDVIYNGIDANNFNIMEEKDNLELKKELNLPIDKKIFISVGSLIERKDPQTIIKAFKKANNENKAHLIILGKGPLYDECVKIKDENISLLGFVNNVSQYYRASDVYISASHSEGLPNTVLEAIGSGLPVILSDIGSHQEIIEKDNKIGSLFELKNIYELKNVIIKYINSNKNIKIKNRARSVLENNFTAEIMSKNYQKYYLDILSEGR